MLFRPPAEQRLDAARNLLDGWNVEADRFRRAALLAERGETPSTVLIEAAEDARLGLTALLDDIDGALERMAPGNPDFAGLLQAQMSAIALYESIGRSCEALDRFAVDNSPSPVRRVVHQRLPLAGAA